MTFLELLPHLIRTNEFWWFYYLGPWEHRPDAAIVQKSPGCSLAGHQPRFRSASLSLPRFRHGGMDTVSWYVIGKRALI